MAQISFSRALGFNHAPEYKYSSPINIRQVFGDEVLEELVRTPAVQRLAAIRFLGGIDYLFVRRPNGIPGNVRYTRLQHSLGVVRLALKYADVVELSPRDRRLIATAALLHDLGHAPLSHSVEPVFRQIFGMDHHKATRDIIFGRVPIGRSVADILFKHCIDLEELRSLIEGKDTRFHGFFSGPINFDTIEGILRSWTFGNAPTAFAPDIVVDAAIRRSSETDRQIVDRFWNYKDQVYRHVINSSSGILADRICQTLMMQNLPAFTENDYYTTEGTFFRKIPGLRALLMRPTFALEARKLLPAAISFVERRFYVNSSVHFEGHTDEKRYSQTKASAVLEIQSKPDESEVLVLEKDLFGDVCD